ncbi:MAG: GSCFA domain-containing protein [Ginsengibacter sp.]
MEFILPFHIKPSAEKITYRQKLLFMGSCFTEEIGNQFKNLKFDVLQNPNGILYDPRSIAYALISYVENRKYNESDLFLQDEIWHSWQHHSAFSGLDKNQVLDKIIRSQSEANTFLQQASWLVITLGTSYNYQLKSNNDFVANCHKASAAFFSKKLIALDEIRLQISDAIGKLQLFNPNLKIVFTISPVRHVRDGIIENNRSKARLIEAVHSIAEENKNVFYFPAYELVIDVLRDYRFYKSDLVHATEASVSYVFEKFCEAYLDDSSKKLLLDLQSLLSAMNHRPFQKESDKYKRFLKGQLERAKKIKEAYAGIDLANEIKYFSK